MNNNFALDYETEKTIYDNYHTAKAADDKTGMSEARAKHMAFSEYMEAAEEDYRMIYRLYKSARDRGNVFLDLNEPYQYRDVDRLLEAFKKFGIENFTFSSEWSSSIETAWEFVKQGCTLEGMAEINGTTTEIWTEKYERIPAYIFKIN